MPLFIPVVLIGCSALLSDAGIKKGADGAAKISTARRVVDEARVPYETALAAAQAQHGLALDALRRYDQLKSEIYDVDLRAFVAAWKALGASELTALSKDPELGELVTAVQLEAIDFELLDAARAILAGGGTAAASWAAAWGAVGTFATASTGTATSELWGIAASNAIRAWFGGGSLAVGGLGARAGASILAGVAAGPAIAVTGLMINAKGNKARDEARRHVAKLTTATAEADAAHATYSYLDQLAGDYATVAKHGRNLFAPQLAVLQEIVERGTSLDELDGEDRDVVMQAANTAKVLKAVLDTPLVDAETRRPDPQAGERLGELRERLGV